MKPSLLTIAIVVSVIPPALVLAGQKKEAGADHAQFAFFESKVRPTLLTSCVSCHGNDKPQGGLRLDLAINDAQAQEVLKRVRGEGGKPRMPIGGELSRDKIAALEEWVKAGAPWPKGSPVAAPNLMERGKSHWAFQPVVRPLIPRVKAKSWVRNPIDAFVLARLESAGLSPSPTASRRELIRRVSYDLIGLPPTPEEVVAFESDSSPKAYENLVDRLLASPHYGEKWARHWLDLVRYAETNSYERDNPKPYVFKYRDYVIRSFNADKPYSEFVREQIAGDELPNATGDSVLATTYYRLGIWDDEPADKLQAMYDDFDDVIATTGQAFLGLTLDCARCHDHKLDPIPQKDYYKFLAFFRNINRFRNGGVTDEARYFANSTVKADYERRMNELKSRRNEYLTQVAAVETKLTAAGPTFFNPTDVSDVSYRLYERDWKRIPDFENEPVISSGNLKPSWISIKPRERNEDFAINYDGQINVPKEGEYTFYFLAEGGYRFTVGGEKLFEVFATDTKPEVKTFKKKLGAGKTGFNLIYNQRQRQHGFAISWSGPGFTRRPLSALDSCPEDGLKVLFGDQLEKVLNDGEAAKLTALVNSQARLEKQSPLTEKVLCVTEVGPKPIDTTILLRGAPTAIGEKVEPGTPICATRGASLVIPNAPADAKTTGRRTVLANWMTSADNPLTPRVMVNRIWQNHFGRGIVRSPNDFGLQGIRPTHPELLDWLAKEFVAQGWSFKRIHKLIMMSNAYKQSSRSNVAGLKADPQNDLFWRFDARRLAAEEIRDSLLAVGGNLNTAMFGPSVYPEIPKEVLANQSRPGKDWYTERMTPEDQCRRSIYVNVKRSLIYPLFANFDLPETDRPAAMRFASTQPTQALSMMNGPFANKQAVVLASRVRKDAGSDPQAFTTRLFRLVLQKNNVEKESKEAVALSQRLLALGTKPEVVQNYLALLAMNLNEFYYID